MTNKKLLTKYFLLAALAVVMVLCLSLSLVFTFVNVYADGETTEPAPSTGEQVGFHDHDNCSNKEDECVAQIISSGGTAGYANLQDALKDAKDGQTVKVLKCFDLSAKLTIEPAASARDITVDFDGHTVTCTSSSAVIELARRTTDDGVKDVVHFVNGKIVNTKSTSNTLLSAKHYRTAYLKDMELECGTYCVSSQSYMGTCVGFIYTLSGTYRTVGNNSPAYISSINKDIFKYIEKGDTVRFERTNANQYASSFTASEFSAFQLPEGYMIDIDADGTSFWVKQDDNKYFIGSNDNIKYATIAEAIEAGNTEVKLNRSVPAKIDGKNLEYVIPAGASVTLDLNVCTFSAKLINNGNVTLTGPNSTTGNQESVFNGVIENVGDGQVVAIKRFTIKDDAKEYILNNTITLNDDSYILVKDGNYEIQESKLEINGHKYSSLTAAIKAGVRDITISKADSWLQKEWDYDWDTETDYIKSAWYNENIIVDIGNSELTITLDEVQLRGLGSVNGLNATLTVISGKVNIIGLTGNGKAQSSLRAPADNASFSPENMARAYAVQNNGELTIDGVYIGGGVYSDTGSVVQGALIRNTGKLVLKDSTIVNSLVDNNHEGVERGSGISTTGGSVELDNVYLNIAGGYGVYATDGATVKLYNGTNNYSPTTGKNIKVGAVCLENGASVELGHCDIYVDSNFDLTSNASDGLCVKKTAGSASNGNIAFDHYQVGEHNWQQPEWKWNENSNLLCNAEFTCAFGGEKVTLPATVTYSTGITCVAGEKVTYTATVQHNDDTYTTSREVTNVNGEHDYVLRMLQPATKTTYKATEMFDMTGMLVQLYCPLCGANAGNVHPDKIDVVYENGDCFHYGDSKVTLSYTDNVANRTYTLDVLVTVNKYDEITLTWQVSRDFEGAEESWQNINEIESLVYDGAKWYFRAIFTNEVTGDTVIVNVEQIACDAKEYVLLADTAQYADYEFDNYDCYVTIERQKINLSDRDLFGFELVLPDGNVELWDGTVYIYETTEQEEYPSLSLLDLTDVRYLGWKLVDTRTVVSSVARYRSEVELSLAVTTDEVKNGSNQLFSYEDINANVARGIGIYTVSVRLIANANYAFDTNYSSAIYNRGLAIDISLDNKTAIVSKVWYVVQLDNWLVDANNAENEYKLEGWVYGDNVNKTAPALAHGDIGDASFALLDNDRTPIGEVFTKEHFNDYVNRSMPAGRYYLQVTIPSLTDEEDGITYRGATILLSFEVKAANIALNLEKDVDTGYLAYEWQLATNREQFFAKFAQELAGKVVLTNVTPTGYWAAVASSSNYTVTYNLSRMYSNNYYAANDNNVLSAIKGGINGTYTVYFQITAKNHNPLTAMNEGRYDYFFTVTVYEVIDTPTFDHGGLVYTGNRVQPQLTASDLYEVVWSNSDTYVNGGNHSIAFKLYDNVHYRWKDNASDTVTVNYTITKATNEWVRTPNIVAWTFESFDTQVNRIRAVVKFLDNGQNIKFAITKVDGTAIAALSNFTVKEDGTIDNIDLVAALNSLKAGWYTLVVTVDGTNNYNELKQSVDFIIGKTINRWADGEEDLVLPSWIVGQFDLEKNPIVVNSLHGEAIVQIRDIEGIVYYDSRNPENNKLNDLEVGKYLLYAWVDETDDFASLAERAFTIEVLEKIGLPWWGTTLVAVGALGLAAAIILILWKLKVFEILTDTIALAITTRATVDATIAAVRATKKAEEAEAHKRKVEAVERLQAAREAQRNKTPEQRAEEMQAKAEEAATKAEQMQTRATKLQKRADKLAAKTEQPQEELEQPQEEQPDDTSTEE